MKKLLLAVALLGMSVQAAFVELKTVAEFEDLVKTSPVPVVVQFEAYWCGPCKNLKSVFGKVASNYSDNQVRLVHIDAYVNKSLSSYLQGGYPTVRTFSNGQLTSPSFAGSKSESYLRNFIDNVIAGKNEVTADFCPVM